MAPRIGIGVGRRRITGYPAILDDGNSVWWEALLKYILLNGGDVAQWDDRSGNDYHLLQATPASQPVWDVEGIIFNGTTEYLKAIFTLVQPEFIYIVFKQITWTHAHYIFDGGTAARGKLQQLNPTPNIIAEAGIPSSGNSNLALDTWGIARVLFNGASSKLIIDDTTPITGNFGSNDMGGFTIGAAPTGILHSNIQVKEIIIRKIADSSENEQKIYDYLIDKNLIYPDSGELISLIVGEEFIIYGDEITSVPIGNSLSVEYTCDIGEGSGNNYSITPEIGDVGSIYLYVKSTNNGEVVRRSRFTLVVKDKVNTGTKSITMIGDSLTALGVFYEFLTIESVFDSMTWTNIGTQGSAGFLNEGYPSQTYDWLVNHTDSPFTKAGVVDIPAYYTDNGLSVPDFITMRMGVNDAFNERTGEWTGTEKTTWLANISELIDAFLAHDANVKIIIGLPSVCCDSAVGWEASYGADPYQDSYITIINQMRDAIIETYSSYDARVSVGYGTWALDRDDGYPKTGGVHTNAVHPSIPGYYELATGLPPSINEFL